ncbi:hypothetical protein [Methylobacterium sp. A54F]
MNSFSDVIDALGIASAAEILGIPESHVRTLKARDSIPPGYFKRLVDSDAGRAAGIGYDLLYRLRERPASNRRPEQAA